MNQEERNRWLALTPEEPVEPDLPIIDCHHHFWDWPDDRFSDTRHYMVEELVADAAGHNVRQTVFVETDAMYRAEGHPDFRFVGEVEFAQGLAAQSASGAYGEMRAAAGIIGTVDLTRGDIVGPVLEALAAASPQRFRGIRDRAAWIEGLPAYPPWMRRDLLIDPAFREGFARLRQYGLVFEAFLFHYQLAQLADLAGAFPDTTIVLNHLGGPHGTPERPGSSDEVFGEWRTGMAAVARHPNVYLKLGGLQMPAVGFGWHTRERPPSSDEMVAVNERWYSHAIELFGPERCMFESNFPVDRMSCSYRVLWNHFKKMTKGFRPDERAAMFHDNAMRVYRLPKH
jgi:L-fuconolactonase